LVTVVVKFFNMIKKIHMLSLFICPHCGKDISKNKDTKAIIGKKGGIARAKKLSPERRSEIAKSAAIMRWKRRKYNEL
jgi:hypothetical protein